MFTVNGGRGGGGRGGRNSGSNAVSHSGGSGMMGGLRYSKYKHRHDMHNNDQQHPHAHVLSRPTSADQHTTRYHSSSLPGPRRPNSSNGAGFSLYNRNSASSAHSRPPPPAPPRANKRNTNSAHSADQKPKLIRPFSEQSFETNTAATLASYIYAPTSIAPLAPSSKGTTTVKHNSNESHSSSHPQSSTSATTSSAATSTTCSKFGRLSGLNRLAARVGVGRSSNKAPNSSKQFHNRNPSSSSSSAHGHSRDSSNSDSSIYAPGAHKSIHSSRQRPHSSSVSSAANHSASSSRPPLRSKHTSQSSNALLDRRKSPPIGGQSMLSVPSPTSLTRLANEAQLSVGKLCR